MRAAIKSIGPHEETISGITFYLDILKNRGVKGVLDTVARFSKQLDEEDGLDPVTMKHHEAAAIHSLLPPVTRGEFLGSMAWAFVGTSSVLGALAKGSDIYYQALTPAKEKADEQAEEADNYAQKIQEFYSHHVLPYEDLLVGIALVNEGVEKWEEIRLRQLEDAVLRMDDLPKDKDRLSQRINQLTVGGKYTDWVAQEFLQKLLASDNGVEAVLGFVQRARKAIDEQNELDLEIDIDPKKWPTERKIFDAIQCHARRLSYRDFLGTWGWMLPGLICTMEGSAKITDAHILGNAPEKENALINRVETYISEPGEILLGLSLVNEFNLNWKKIKLKQLADAIIYLKHQKIDWETIEPMQLHELIENMEEPEEKFAGIYFLKTLLAATVDTPDRKGIDKIHEFLSRAHELLDKGSAEDLPGCFTPAETKIFKSIWCRPNLFNMENSMHTVGWGGPGVICLMTGAASAADITMRMFTGNKKTFIAKAKHWLHDYLGPLESIVIGIALLYEALEKFREYHIAHISDATAQLSQQATDKMGVRFK